MPTIVLDLLKYVFLAVLYIFMARAVRAMLLELRAGRTSPQAAPARKAQPQRAPARRSSKKNPRKLTIVEGEEKKGRTVNLDGEVLIGRAERCDLVLQDTYASQVHARIFPKSDAMMVEDMGSTNGTYLNRQKVSAPKELQRGDQIKIGKTVMELRR
jgi:pSer/pThr/pTyr-binding forkhead associated (FHA) protein